MTFTTVGLSLLVSAAFSSGASLVPPQPFVPAAETIQEYVADYFYDAPIMVKIAKCESTFRQFDKNGSIHRGKVNRADLGVMQINEYYHGDTALKLGIDLYSIEGNVEYARYLYEKEGTKPWLSSAKCWNKNEHIALK